MEFTHFIICIYPGKNYSLEIIFCKKKFAAHYIFVFIFWFVDVAFLITLDIFFYGNKIQDK